MPTPGHATLKKVHEAYRTMQVDKDGDVNLDQLNDKLIRFEDAMSGDNNSDGEEGESFTVGDTIGKALVLVTQVLSNGHMYE